MAPDPKLVDLLLRHEELCAHGRDVPVEELCRDCPDLLDDVKRWIASLKPLNAFLEQGKQSASNTPAIAERAETPPQRLEKIIAGSTYEVLQFHARGGLGEIHRAKDAMLHREVALKRLKSPVAQDSPSGRRFHWEAMVTGLLEHPGVVPLYGVGEDQHGQPCYIMRFIQGETFQAAIRRLHDEASGTHDLGTRRLPFRQLLQRFVAVCNTVAYAHSRGIVHRDIKPDNILLGGFGETLLVDWGLAKRVSGPAESQSNGEPAAAALPGEWEGTQGGSVVGTPAYMSPEQASGNVAGTGSDIYGLGATFYVMLTGKVPFPGPHIGQVLENVRQGNVAAPREVNRTIPRPLDAICQKAMALAPEARYATASAFAADLEQWLADEPVSAYPEPIWTRWGRWARRHKTLVTASVLFLVFVGLSYGLISQEAATRLQAQRDRTYDRLELFLAAPASDVPGKWDAIGPADGWVLGRLRECLQQPFRSETAKTRASWALLATDQGQVAFLGKLLLDSEPEEGRLILDRLVECQDSYSNDPLLSSFVQEAEKRPGAGLTDKENDVLASRRANAAVALVRLGKPGTAWPLLKHDPEPRLGSFLVHRLYPLGVSPEVLVQAFKQEKDVGIRRAVMASLGPYAVSELGKEDLSWMLEELEHLFVAHPDSGIHAAADWLLRRWGRQDRIQAMEGQVAKDGFLPGKNWYVTSEGHTLVVFRDPEPFLMGSPEDETDRGERETLHVCKIPRSFAVAGAEVTVAQFQKFKDELTPEHQRYSPAPACPMIAVTWFDAALYCRWLSAQEGLPEEEMCYMAPSGPDDILRLYPNYLTRKGYRLPTEAEWEYACRAGTGSRRFFGSADVLLPYYAWFQPNAQERAWPIKNLQPNAFGLFDMYGNVSEWCQDRVVSFSKDVPIKPGMIKEDSEDRFLIVTDQEDRVLRGGAFTEPNKQLRSAQREVLRPTTRLANVGFRVARTLAATKSNK